MTNEELTTTQQTAVVAEQGAPVAPGKASSKKGASPKKGAPKGQQSNQCGPAKEKQPGPSKKAPKRARAIAPRAESKAARILAMIGRAKGATLAEIMKAADWQAHSVRGFISTAGKKHGVKIESTKSEAGDRVYRIVK